MVNEMESRIRNWRPTKIAACIFIVIVSLTLEGLTLRLWFSPASEVPMYRQLATQVQLAILSGDLKPGERLPSTRELARRFSIHPNTVSAGYRQLVRDGWVEYRHGSGVYIQSEAAPAQTPEQILDQHIVEFFKTVRELRLPAVAIRQRVAEWIAAPPPDHFVLIDPDVDAREILLTEIRKLTTWPAAAISIEEARKPEAMLAAIPLCRPSKTKMVRAVLPAGTELIPLQIRSANQWLDPGAAFAEGQADWRGFELGGFSRDCPDDAGGGGSGSGLAGSAEPASTTLAAGTRSDRRDYLRCTHGGHARITKGAAGV